MKNANAYLNSRRFAIEALKNFDWHRACSEVKRMTRCDRASGNSNAQRHGKRSAIGQ